MAVASVPAHEPVAIAGSAESVDVLALLEEGRAADLIEAAPDLAVRATRSPEAFVAELATRRPRVVLVAVPPATPAVVDAVAWAQRRRSTLRSVLLNDVDDVAERLRALGLGFDAALPLATSTSELRGRLALLARPLRSPPRERIAISEGLELDIVRCCLLRNGRSVHLRPKEYRLLELFCRHPGRVYTRAELLDRVWGVGHAGNQRTVDVHVRWVRAKVERDPETPVHLVTVRGMGYRFELEGGA